MRRTLLGLALLTAVTSSPAVSQTEVALEVLGLRTWTTRMVEDSVARYRPGLSLTDAACAIILRDSVGFANAAVASFENAGPGSGPDWVVLTVVEPGDAEKVSFRPASTELERHPEWEELFDLLEQDRQAVSYLQHRDFLLARSDSFFGGEIVPASAVRLRDAVRRHRTSRDWELARLSLLEDANRVNRGVAALVLSNFAERDSTWHLLAEGLRHRSDFGTSMAEMVLSTLAGSGEHRVDWTPARGTLEALLGGTNLFVYTEVLSALVRTGIGPALGRDLARTNPHLLLDHLGAKNPYTPPAAREFLVHVSGQDFGTDVGAWRAWLGEAADR